jgi:KaiC/GvpD/RAD55 family RecA-like ATPase
MLEQIYIKSPTVLVVCGQALVKGILAPLLAKAKEYEKRYEWLQAAEVYSKATKLALKHQDPLKATGLQERLGFCFYRSAFQAQTNIEFRKLLKQAINAYETESQILGEIKEENNQAKLDDAHALVTYTKSWLETKISKKRKLIDEWWTIENQVLKAYESSGDLHSVGKTCNNLIEWSSYDRFHLEKTSAVKEKIFKETILLAEKSIQALSKLDNKYELARAYCSYSGYHGFIENIFEDENESLQFTQKCRDYANKALELSQEIGDAYLIGRSYFSAASAVHQLVEPFLLLEIAEKILKQGKIAKDNYLIGWGKTLTSESKVSLVSLSEDPNKARETLEKAVELAQEATNNFETINHVAGLALSYHFQSFALECLARFQIDPKKRHELLEISNKVIQEGLARFGEWNSANIFYFTLSINLTLLSHTKTNLEEKRDLLQKAIYYAKKGIPNQGDEGRDESGVNYFYIILCDAQLALANIEQDNNKRIKLLNSAVSSEEKYVQQIEKKKKIYAQTEFGKGFHFGYRYYKIGAILRQIYSLTKEQKTLDRAIEAFKKAIAFWKSAELPTREAESCWIVAQLNDLKGEWQKASQNYEFAAETYVLATKKIPSLKQFYLNYASYMRAWSQIEQAKYSHSIEDYNAARENYEKAADFHKLTDRWNYLAPNYFAWTSLEEAEGLSRKEHTQQAKQAFRKAYEQFSKAEKSIRQELDKIIRYPISLYSLDEREMIQRLLSASDFRCKYCQARILLEDAKLLDKEGKYLLSSKSYQEAAQNLSAIVEKIDVEAERKELELLMILCRAWEKMAKAEEKTTSRYFLEAATLFEQAQELCVTKKASLWALGNSNFCRGLAAGVKYQTTLDLANHSKAKGYIKNAGTNYLQAGFKTASQYAKATQRLFDAYLCMNQAESEANQEKRAKHYQLAENLLQIAADSFIKAKQPEKTAQVQQILQTVREEKALAVSLTELMHAPTVTSSTFSFTAPTPTNETSVGLESFEHANVQANLVTNAKEVKVGESFSLSVEFVNSGREPALLMRVDDFVPQDFVVVKKPEIYRVEESCLNMKGKQLAPLKLVEVKLTLQASKKGDYRLNPKVQYLDERGQNKTLQLKTLMIQVEEIILEDRVTTGTDELDSLLLGGIPKEYAVALAGPPSDEREIIVKNFLRAGVEEGVSFYVTTEATDLEDLLNKPNFFLFLCNPKPKVDVPNLPNVFKLQGKTDLNNLGIALTKAYRSIDQNLVQPKRVCVEILSEVLQDYGSNTTRKWISDLITNYGAKGFTMLAVLDMEIHPPEQSNAVLHLFDGEISIIQSDDPLDCRKSILVKKLRNQDYIKNPICLR